MVDERYISDNPDILMFHVIEECSEVIEQCNTLSDKAANLQKAICKANRFGLDSIVPNSVTTINQFNRENLIGELEDMIKISTKLVEELKKGPNYQANLA